METTPAANVELLCLDVDGVMTDGSIRLDDNAVETKRFHVRDGTGIKLWMKLGYQVAIITGRTGQVVVHRARELGITHVIQGTRDKAAALEQVLRELALAPEQAAVMADDLPDLPMMHRAGYAMAVADAVDEVRQQAAFVTTRPGGAGAVREAVEHLLKARDRWHEAVGFFG
ncbi:MAG: KdsC family phosphatase [Planctomycetota bacterium]|jgi:YrbI family 3-deoxy-D-manno-octulosonate 8-phosphate phosphatase